MQQILERKSTVIPRRIMENGNSVTKKLRVAAYARVSTDREEQEDSFERQVSYYTRYINANVEWEFAGIYADPGITGTQADMRPDFLKMMDECKKGNIDKILVKSVARFARNTVDALKYIRELKEIGIGVYFETSATDTLTPGGEIMVTILAAMAEEESRTISKNVKWSIEKKFQNGDMMLNYTRFLGYTKNDKGELVIVPEEAEIIKRIYKEYLYGYSTHVIAKHLDNDKIPTPSNGKKWYNHVVLSILTNEKYCGTALMNKTYKIDVVSKKRKKNEGQKEMYILENHHPAIISKETFELVQDQMQERKEVSGYSKNNQGKYTSKYPFSKKIVCGECGNYYRRHAQYVRKEYIVTWVCAKHKLDSAKCHQLYITENEIKKAFVKAMNILINDFEEVNNTLIDSVKAVITDDDLNKLETIISKITTLQSEMMDLYKNKLSGKITSDEYKRKAIILQENLNVLNEQKAKLEENKSTMNLARNRLEEITKVINEYNEVNEFDEEMFNRLITKIIIRNRYELEFEFKCGINQIIIVK